MGNDSVSRMLAFYIFSEMKDLQTEIPDLEKTCKSTEKELADTVKEEQELSGKVIYLHF